VVAIAQAPVKAEDAARNAYYAAFHAAKAFIFERTGTTQKRHGSVHKQFAQLAQTEPTIDQTLRTFLPIAYDYKRIGDYDIGASGKITPADAVLALKEAERFVATIGALLP
jgi:uncharacterized protein (UPF0332 family)